MCKNILTLLFIGLSLACHAQWEMDFDESFAAASSAWTPLSLGTKLACWFDASDASTVLDASGNVATNGASVQTWKDKSGNTRDATASTTARRPRLFTNTINGFPVVSTDGTNQLDITGAGSVFRNKGAGYVFAVSKDSNPIGGDTGHILVFFSRDINNSVRLAVYSRATPTGYGAGCRRLDGDGFTAVNTLYATNTPTLSITFGDWSNGNVRSSVNQGVYTSTALPSGAGLTSDTEGAASSLFADLPNNRAPSGSEIAEVIVVNATLSTDEVSKIRAYLKTKWATP